MEQPAVGNGDSIPSMEKPEGMVIHSSFTSSLTPITQLGFLFSKPYHHHMQCSGNACSLSNVYLLLKKINFINPCSSLNHCNACIYPKVLHGALPYLQRISIFNCRRPHSNWGSSKLNIHFEFKFYSEIKTCSQATMTAECKMNRRLKLLWNEFGKTSPRA